MHNRITCLVVEDEALSIEMMEDYIARRDDLELIGIASQLADLEEIVKKSDPSIIFLDLVIPIGKSTEFHFGQLPKTASIVVISAMPLTHYTGELPKGEIFELYKPISFENFDRCIDEVIVKRKEH